MALPEIIKDIEARVKDTGDTMTGQLLIDALEPSGNTQYSLLKVISKNASSSTNNAWVGRMMFGAKDLTFLMGTYKGMAGIGAHSWTDAISETGASWAPIYINPDNSQPIYLGADGAGWTPGQGTLIVQGSTTKGAGIVTINGTLNLNGVINSIYLDDKYINVSGDTMIGPLAISGEENYISTNWLNNQPANTNHAIHLGTAGRN